MLSCFIDFQMPQKNTKQYKQVKFYFKVLCKVEIDHRGALKFTILVEGLIDINISF